MAKAIDHTSKWQAAIDLSVVYSNCLYEEYPNGTKIANDTFKLVAGEGEEFCEDYCNGMELLYFLETIERMYVLDWLDRLDDYGKNILEQLKKKEGEARPSRSFNWPDVYKHISRHNWYTPQDVSVAINKNTAKGHAPVFQSRRNWNIVSGFFCNRCGGENHHSYDYSCTARGRFGFGFIPAECALTRKSILFRKFS